MPYIPKILPMYHIFILLQPIKTYWCINTRHITSTATIIYGTFVHVTTNLVCEVRIFRIPKLKHPLVIAICIGIFVCPHIPIGAFITLVPRRCVGAAAITRVVPSTLEPDKKTFEPCHEKTCLRGFATK